MNSSGLKLIFVLATLIWGFLFVSAFSIQIVKHDEYQSMAQRNAQKSKIVRAARGKIMDRNGALLVENIPEGEHASRFLLRGNLASQILGRVGRDGHGSMGLEQKFDKELRGRNGYSIFLRAARQKELPFGTEDFVEARAGHNLVLTIDASMQEILEHELKMGVEEFKAHSASAVVVDPYTGDILAAATYADSYGDDENALRWKCDIFSFSYEPGSTFKVVTALAALEENVVSMDSVFDDEHGKWYIVPGERPIGEHDGKDLGPMNMTQALAKSSNIVYGKIAQAVGKENFYRFVRNFGFGSKTSSVLPGEEHGTLHKPYKWQKRDLPTLGFGHFITVTPIQMAMAFSAVANGGNLLEPRIVLAVRDSNNVTVDSLEPVLLRRMVSESTAAKLREMLLEVVSSGTGSRVKSKILPELDFGGKTGTAEKYRQDQGKYDRKSQVASFIGLAPALNPKYVCLVLVDDPQTRSAGGSTAGPIFRRIMEGIYFHPKLSPIEFRHVREAENRRCDLNLNGMNALAAKNVAAKKNCALGILGEGESVVSTVRESSDSLTVTLGGDRVLEMPNLVGMSLREALDVLGKARLPVEYLGRGRVFEQFPEPSEKLERGQVCKLRLKEDA